jgi:methyl-accepting chemotaxis protein
VLNGSFLGRTGVADPSAAAVGHKAGRTLSGEDGFEGWAQSVGYMTYPGVKWTLVASQSRDEVLQPVRDLGVLMLLTGLGAAVAIVGGAWVVARPIEHGVRQVSTAASGLARGDLDQQVEVRSRDELGQMATAVREMIAYQQQIAGVAGRVAEGDLRVTVTPVSDRDVLGVAVSRMVARLGELLSETRASADGLADTSTMMENVTGEVAQTVGHVSASVRHAANNAREQSASMAAASRSVDELLIAIEQVARGAQEQAQDLTSASAQAEEMARGVERVAHVAERVSESSRASHETAERGVFAVRDAVAGMSEIEHVVEVASARVTGLGALGDRIGSVVDTINEIAQQTNLLALNASIEAARAGEHGRGFAVVAGEVRKLAERSQRETHAIEELIREVREGTEDAVRAMEDGVERVRTGARKADEAGQALAEILAAVETTVGEVDEIAEASNAMMQGGRDVSDALVRLSAVVEQSSATAEEMTATADEVGRSVQGMASVVEVSTRELEDVAESAERMHEQMASIESRADRLAQTAAGLRALVTRFQLADTPAMEAVEAAEATARSRRPSRERRAS